MDHNRPLKEVKANVRTYKEPLPAALKTVLVKHYKPYQEALWKLLGTELDLSEE